jgi:rhodanese-related sulfurtransferase
MPEPGFETVTRSELSRRLDETRPDNSDPREGFALVNVLKPEAFAAEHIPVSINIPVGNEEEFEKRFSKDKDIVLYCASSQCDASPTVAKRLSEQGFTHIYDYEAGMKDWKESGGPVETGATSA